ANAKISAGTHIALNDTVNEALFKKPEGLGITPAAATAGIDGWDNLNRFFAATERTTLEPLTQRKEVTTTLSFGHAESFAMTESESFGEPGPNQGAVSARTPGVGVDYKYSHAYREEILRTPTLEKVTVSDTFSDTATISGGVAVRLGGTVATDGGAAEGLAM